MRLNLMQRTISDLWDVTRHLIDDAHGEARPDHRPTVDTRSPAYYFECVLRVDSQYREEIAHLKAEIGALERDPEADGFYLDILRSELREKEL